MAHTVLREQATTVPGGVQLAPAKAGGKSKARASSPVQLLRGAGFSSLLRKLIFTRFNPSWKSGAVSFAFFQDLGSARLKLSSPERLWC